MWTGIKKLLGIPPKKFVLVDYDNEADGIKRVIKCTAVDKIQVLEETETTYLLERPINSYLLFKHKKIVRGINLKPQRVPKNHPDIREDITEE